jgi:hypothetical protein
MKKGSEEQRLRCSTFLGAISSFPLYLLSPLSLLKEDAAAIWARVFGVIEDLISL